MNAYFDTSFIAALYVKEANSATAVGWLQQNRQPVTLTAFGELELVTAILQKQFYGDIGENEVERINQTMEADLQQGTLTRLIMPFEPQCEKAIMLSRQFTGTLGCRSLDILHVAAALAVGADYFLTFDLRQKKLAKAAGLTVKP